MSILTELEPPDLCEMCGISAAVIDHLCRACYEKVHLNDFDDDDEWHPASWMETRW
jgi:hypothetical protein